MVRALDLSRPQKSSKGLAVASRVANAWKGLAGGGGGGGGIGNYLHYRLLVHDGGQGPDMHLWKLFLCDSIGGPSVAPVMGGVATASSLEFPTRPPDYAFEDIGERFYWGMPPSFPEWVTYEFPEEVTIVEYAFYWGNSILAYAPREWTFQASNDGETWADLDYRVNASLSNLATTRFTIPTE